MLQGAVLVYGVVTAFVLSSAERNRKTARPHSRMIHNAGWVLMGSSFGTAGLLGMMAIQHAAG